MLKIEIVGRGALLDVTGSLLRATHESEMNSGASRFRCTLLKSEELAFFEGDVVLVSFKDKLFFKGRIFTKSRNDFNQIEILAYDSLRYLKNKDTLIFRNRTAAQIISEIVSEQKLEIGSVASTEHVILSMVAENMSYLDMAYDALRRNLIATGELYTLFEEEGKISLKKTSELSSGVHISDEDLSALSYSSSIDNGTANKIKILRRSGGFAEEQILREDALNVEKWGALTLFYEADPLENLGMLSDKADKMLQAYNRIMRTLEVGCPGEISCVAGSCVNVSLTLDSMVEKPFVIKKARHSFERGTHFMSLTLATNNWN